MTGRVRTPALVLRTRAFRDDDLVVDFLGQTTGRVSALARGARKSQRRYGGAIELGARVDLELVLRPGRDLQGLTRCDVVVPIRHARAHLGRIAALAYVLELVRLCAQEGQADAALYGLAAEIVDTLETCDPTPESVLLWELALLATAGHAATPAAVSREAELDPAARATLDRLLGGDAAARFDSAASTRLRVAFDRLWLRAVGHAPRSARFLDLQPAPGP